MYKRALCLALLALVAGAANGLAQAPEKLSKEELALRRPPAVQAAALATVPETEPNDDHTMATAVTFGDEATGVIDPAGDWDYYSFSATAGQIIVIDVDAADVGSDLDPVIELFGSDGQTSIEYNDDWNSLDSRIEYTVETTGTHFLAIAEYGDYFGGSGSGGPTYTYSISFSILEPGPGDPITTLVSNLRCVEGWAVADDGTIYVGDPCYSSIYTIEPNGTGADFATDLVAPGPMTFDAFGNLIVIDYSDGNVYKVAMDGTRDTFAVGLNPGWVETAPDGSIWLGLGGGINAPQTAENLARLPATSLVYQFDALGTRVDSLMLTGFYLVSAEFSPDGYLHFTSGDTIWKVVDGTPQAVIGGGRYMMDLAFDADGNIYMTHNGVVALYAADGTLLDDSFAVTPNHPWKIMFGRNADGSANTTIYLTDWDDNGITSPARVPDDGSTMIVKLNPAGPDAPGAQVGISVELMADDDIADALMGDLDALTDGEMDFLDFMGNQNGQFDIGDLRAYLIYIGVLPEN